jgi:predicted nucleic-acid-binding protein
VIGLDTNVLVSYLVQDDAAQARAASRLIETRCTNEDPGFVSLLMLAELVWVLDRAYGYARHQVSDVLNGILTAAELKVEQPDLARRALVDYGNGPADFADYLIGHVNAASGCSTTATFDKRAMKSGLHTLVR